LRKIVSMKSVLLACVFCSTGAFRLNRTCFALRKIVSMKSVLLACVFCSVAKAIDDTVSLLQAKATKYGASTAVEMMKQFKHSPESTVEEIDSWSVVDKVNLVKSVSQMDTATLATAMTTSEGEEHFMKNAVQRSFWPDFFDIPTNERVAMLQQRASHMENTLGGKTPEDTVNPKKRKYQGSCTSGTKCIAGKGRDLGVTSFKTSDVRDTAETDSRFQQVCCKLCAVENCGDCESSFDGVCAMCLTGFQLKDGQCGICAPGCETCTGAESCDSCKAGYKMANGQCVEDRPAPPLPR